MSQPPPPPSCIACSIFRAELEALRDRGELDVPVRYLDSMMHLHPERLERALSHLLDRRPAGPGRTLLIFGDCHPRMSEHEERAGVDRVRGLNCVEILLGRERYRALLGDGVFFFLPEWAHRWREIFERGLGLEREVSGALLRELQRRFVYLDTGLAPVPTEVMDEISAYFELPWEVIEVDLSGLRRTVQRALEAPPGAAPGDPPP